MTEKKMKRVILIAALAAGSLGAMAQTKAVTVESPIVSEKDFVWYTEQKEAWKEVTRKNPKDELRQHFPPGHRRDGGRHPRQLHL